MNNSTKHQIQLCLRDIAQSANIVDANSTFQHRADECLRSGEIELERIGELLRDIGVMATTVVVGNDIKSLPAFAIWTDEDGHLVSVIRSGVNAYQVTAYHVNEVKSINDNDLYSMLANRTIIAVTITQRSFLLPAHDQGYQDAPPPSAGYKGVRFRDVWPLMKNILSTEKKDIWYVITYSIFVSLLGLVVPLSSQAIVNAVALGVFSQQLVVLCVVVFLAMIITAVMVVFERHLIDLIQRRIFVTTAFDIVHRVPRIREDAVRGIYVPELVNRFFDVITVQKTLGKFLLEGVGALLILLTGLLVLFLYHPFFLVYDLIFIGFIPFLVLILGRGALTTSVSVSNAKYDTAAWLEEVARNQRTLKLDAHPSFAQARLDGFNISYVDAKARHFRVIARQMLGSYIFKAFATVGILALGGVLVLEQAISLGQLVAAEIIIIMIIGALEKLLTQFDDFYDFAAALYKLNSIVKLPSEQSTGQPVPFLTDGGTIVFDNVSFSDECSSELMGVSLTVNAGEHVSIVGSSGSGKSTIAKMILGLLLPKNGHVRINGVDTSTADLSSLRTHVGYLDPDDALLPGTIYDNITLGRPVSDESIKEVLGLCLLTEEVQSLKKGLRTEVVAQGANLSYSLRRRILLARVLIGRPDIIVIDSAFQSLEDGLKMQLVEALMRKTSCTIVNVSVDYDIIHLTRNSHVLDDGRLVCSGTAEDITSQRPDLQHLFGRNRTLNGGSK